MMELGEEEDELGSARGGGGCPIATGGGRSAGRGRGGGKIGTLSSSPYPMDKKKSTAFGGND